MADFSNSGKKKNCNLTSVKSAKKTKMAEKQLKRRAHQEASQSDFFRRRAKRSVA
jgi:hypothetical protein